MYLASVAARRAEMCSEPVPGQRGGRGVGGPKSFLWREESIVIVWFYDFETGVMVEFGGPMEFVRGRSGEVR